MSSKHQRQEGDPLIPQVTKGFPAAILFLLIDGANLISTMHRTELQRGKRAWEGGLSEDPCCMVNYPDNKSRKKVCLDSLSCRLLLWQLGRDICSAQPCAVGVDDHTFLMSILKLSLSNQPGSSPLWELWYQEVEQLGGGASQAGSCEVLGQRQIQLHHPLSLHLPKAGRTGVCLSCFFPPSLQLWFLA